MSRRPPVHPNASRWFFLSLALAYFCLARLSAAEPPTAQPKSSLPPERVVLPRAVPDPIEPLNRIIWGFNRALMSALIKPTARVYRFIVPRQARTGINNFNRNITYPGRLINNLL